MCVHMCVRVCTCVCTCVRVCTCVYVGMGGPQNCPTASTLFDLVLGLSKQKAVATGTSGVLSVGQDSRLVSEVSVVKQSSRLDSVFGQISVQSGPSEALEVGDGTGKTTRRDPADPGQH